MKNLRAVCAALFVACIVGNAIANDGNLDPIFGDGGIALTDFHSAFTRCGPVVQPDRKILVCGTSAQNGGGDFVVARLTAAGQPDTSFGFDGQATIDFDGGSGTDVAMALALQNDGRIVVVGTTSTDFSATRNDFAIARLTSNGTLDQSFGAGTGKKVVSFGRTFGSNDDDAADVAIQADGKIVVVGTVETASHGTDFGVLRLLADGTLDSSFNLSGMTAIGFDLADSTTFDDTAKRVVVDSAGRIVVAGYANKGPGTLNTDYAVARLLPNGQLDANFSADGRLTIAFDLAVSGQDGCLGMTLQADSKIVLSGVVETSSEAPLSTSMGIVRLQPDGSADMSFGINGKTLVNFDVNSTSIAYGYDVLADSNGRLVVIGVAVGGLLIPGVGMAFIPYGAAARLDTSGSLDPSFGTLGQQTYDFGLTSPSGQVFLGAALQNHDIIVGGIVVVSATLTDNFFVARLCGARRSNIDECL